MEVDAREQASLPVAAVARRIGVAPATLRTWDRRYGIGPAVHQPGQHRLYSRWDLTRLEALRDLLLDGVTVAEAARRISASTAILPRPSPRRAPKGDRPAPATGAAARGVTARQVREASLRLDADRLVKLLRHAVTDRGVIAAWDTVIRPALVWLGDRWESSDGCVAAEHVLSDCATTVLRAVDSTKPAGGARPVLLVCAPGEAHVLPLCALGAALAEREVRSALVGAATPGPVTAEAIRRIKPSGVVVWSQTPQTASREVLSARPQIRSGHLVVAAGPGWNGLRLPQRVQSPASITAAVALLTDGLDG